MQENKIRRDTHVQICMMNGLLFKTLKWDQSRPAHPTISTMPVRTDPEWKATVPIVQSGRRGYSRMPPGTRVTNTIQYLYLMARPV